MRAAEEQAIAFASQAIEEYKKIADFAQEVTKAGVDAYLVGFTNCKNKVTQVFLQLDLSDVLVETTFGKKEGEKGETSEEEAVRTTEGEGGRIEGPPIAKLELR